MKSQTDNFTRRSNPFNSTKKRLPKRVVVTCQKCSSDDLDLELVEVSTFSRGKQETSKRTKFTCNTCGNIWQVK